MIRLTLVVALVALLVTPAMADNWQMAQRDMWNTGRANWLIAEDDTIFDNILWQTPVVGTSLNSTSMTFYDGAYNGLDIVLGTYHGMGIQGMDRHTGSLFWSGNPDAGEQLAQTTPAFSNDGSIVYAANTYPAGCSAWYTTADPTAFWDNSGDPSPGHLNLWSPTIAPDGRIFLHEPGGLHYAGTDTPGVKISETWAAATSTNPSRNDPALYMKGDDLVVVSSGMSTLVTAWNGATGAQLWSTTVPVSGGNANVTIDPANGNIYLACGWSTDIWVVGLDIDGNRLWDDNKVWDASVGGAQLVNTSGCLSHDGSTYYFPTHSHPGYDAAQLNAINTADGSLKWSYATGCSVWTGLSSSPIVTPNGVIIVGNNNGGGTFYAIKDAGTHGTVLDTFVVDATGIACQSATLADDGKLYLPLRTVWVASNGDDDVPDGSVQNLFTCFQTTLNVVPGDVDGNGVVDGLDLTAVLTAWDTVPGDPLWNEDADLDDNDVVNGLDLTEVISNWTTAAVAAPKASPAEAVTSGLDTSTKPGRGDVNRGKGNVRRK